MTLNLTYTDWAYSSTIFIEGGYSHATAKFTGNYGDYADLMCASDKADPDNENVECNGAEIMVDSEWDDSMTFNEMKQLSQMTCDYLLDGLMSFDDLIE